MKTIDFVKDSDVLKALGHPLRLKIVEGLMLGDGCNVSKIVEELIIPQSTASQHLKILKQAGIISVKKEGVQACYSVIDKRVVKIIKILKS